MVGYWKNEKEVILYKTNPVSYKETVEEVGKYPTKSVEHRNVRQETLEKFGVKTALSEEDGSTVVAVYFPSYNQQGKLVGYKKQDLTKEKHTEGHWSTIGSVSVSNKLFGQEVSEKINRKRSSLTYTEGEWDALSCYQALREDVKNTKYEHLEPFVVSLPLGTGAAVEATLHNQEFITSFEAVNFFFDDDSCTPKEKSKGCMKGHEARDAVANALIGCSIGLFVTTPPAGFKDASDMLQAGNSQELAKLVSFGKRAYSAEKVVKISEIAFEDIIQKRKEGVMVECFPKLMRKIRGFREGELVVLTSPSGVGKSTTTSIIANSLIDKNKKVGMIYLEERNSETVQRIIASKLKVNYNEFKNDPTKLASVEDIKKAFDDIVHSESIVLLDHFGSLPISDLMSKIRHMHFIEKCNFIVLDHLSVVISGSDIKDERKELDMVMTELASFCAANDVGIIAVSHIKRIDENSYKSPKGKEDEPFWIKVSKEMLRGSASLEQLSWIILGLEPQIMPDRSRGNVRLTVLKNRPWSYLGVADEFSIDENTWEVVLQDANSTDGKDF